MIADPTLNTRETATTQSWDPWKRRKPVEYYSNRNYVVSDTHSQSGSFGVLHYRSPTDCTGTIGVSALAPSMRGDEQLERVRRLTLTDAESVLHSHKSFLSTENEHRRTKTFTGLNMFSTKQRSGFFRKIVSKLLKKSKSRASRDLKENISDLPKLNAYSNKFSVGDENSTLSRQQSFSSFASDTASQYSIDRSLTVPRKPIQDIHAVEVQPLRRPLGPRNTTTSRDRMTLQQRPPLPVPLKRESARRPLPNISLNTNNQIEIAKLTKDEKESQTDFEADAFPNEHHKKSDSEKNEFSHLREQILTNLELLKNKLILLNLNHEEMIHEKFLETVKSVESLLLYHQTPLCTFQDAEIINLGNESFEKEVMVVINDFNLGSGDTHHNENLNILEKDVDEDKVIFNLIENILEQDAAHKGSEKSKFALIREKFGKSGKAGIDKSVKAPPPEPPNSFGLHQASVDTIGTLEVFARKGNHCRPSGFLRMLARKKVLGNYTLGKTVGQGAFSKVKLGIHKETGQKVAIKIIDKKQMALNAAKSKKAAEERERKKMEKAKAGSQKNAEQPLSSKEKSENPENIIKTGLAADTPSFISSLQLEVQLLMRLDHPNIINLYSVMETENECFVVMEYAAGGELIEYIAARNYLSEKEARKFFRQIISAIDHCHMAHVVHRDLKLENLLLNDRRDILISDFGLGRTFNPNIEEHMKTFCGTPNYAAVEVISGIPYNGVKSDIWAMGVVLYIMMTGSPPFVGENISQLYSKIKAVDYKCPEYFSADLRSLISKMLKKDATKRADIEMLRADPWVNYEEIERPLRIVPKVTAAPNSSQISQFVHSILKDPNYVIYSIHQHTRDGKSVDGASQDKNKTLQKQNARRKSISAQPTMTYTFSVTVEDAGSGRESIKKPSITEETMDFKSLEKTPEIVMSPANNFSSVSKFYSPQPNRGGRRNTITYDPGEAKNHHRRASADATALLKGNAEDGSVPVSATLLMPMSPNPGRYRRTSELPTPEDHNLSVIKRMSMVSPDANEFASANNSIISRSNSTEPDEGSPSPTSEILMRGRSDTFYSQISQNQPSEKEIEDWHLLHKPPKEIRSDRYPFNPKTTSNFPPSSIFQEVHRVLVITSKFYEDKIRFKRLEDFYVFRCKFEGGSENDSVEFEVEVCKIWLLKLHGVKMKRISGSALKFKEIYSHILDTLKI